MIEAFNLNIDQRSAAIGGRGVEIGIVSRNVALPAPSDPGDPPEVGLPVPEPPFVLVGDFDVAITSLPMVMAAVVEVDVPAVDADVAVTGLPMVMAAELTSPATADVAITGQPMVMASVLQEQSINAAITGQPMTMVAELVSPASADVAVAGMPMTMAAVVQERAINVAVTGQPMSMAAVLEVVIPLEPETDALLAALTGTYNSARQEAINTMILDLKDAGVWAKYDQICVTGLNITDSLVNWKSPGTFNPSLVGSPAFAADRGFTGSTGNYINSNFNPVTAAGNYSQDSAHLAVYNRTDANSNGFEIGSQQSGTLRRSGIRLSRASSPTGRGEWVVNSNSISATGGITGNLGLYLATRTAASGADATKFYGDSGAILGTSSTVSNTLLDQPFYVLAINNNGSPGNQSNRQLAAWSIGAGLTDTEAADYRAALETYLDFIGAGVV